jgi:hypothetical protein
MPKVGTDEFSDVVFGQPGPRFKSGKASPRPEDEGEAAGVGAWFPEFGCCARLAYVDAAIATAMINRRRIRYFFFPMISDLPAACSLCHHLLNSRHDEALQLRKSPQMGTTLVDPGPRFQVEDGSTITSRLLTRRRRPSDA